MTGPSPANQQPYPGPPQGGMPAPGPSPTTARIAAILALLGVVHMLVLSVTAAGAELSVATASEVDVASFGTIKNVQVIGAIIIGLLLLSGGILLLACNQRGRWIVTAGCAIDIVFWALTGVWLQSFMNKTADSGFDGAYATGMGIGVFIVLVFPVATLVLANVKATASWLESASG